MKNIQTETPVGLVNIQVRQIRKTGRERFEPVKENVMFMFLVLEPYTAAVHVWLKAKDVVG